MPVITFWSNNQKSIGQSVSAALAATMMSMEHNYKILLLSADYNDPTLENCFGAQESNKEIVKTLVNKNQFNLESGTKGLLKLADSNRVTPDIIHDYTKIIFKNRLEILYSPTDIEKKRKPIIMEEFKNIIMNASRYYDYVIVDLKKGMEYPSQLEILKMSDVVVENIEPSIDDIENFLKDDELKDLMGKLVWNICRHNSKSKFNSKNLIRKVFKKQTIFEIPYNTLVYDAAHEGNITELLIRLRTVKSEDENVELVKKIQELVQGILMKYQETRMRM